MANAGQGLRGAHRGGTRRPWWAHLSPSPEPGWAPSGTPGVTWLACRDIFSLGRAWHEATCQSQRESERFLLRERGVGYLLLPPVPGVAWPAAEFSLAHSGLRGRNNPALRSGSDLFEVQVPGISQKAGRLGSTEPDVLTPGSQPRRARCCRASPSLRRRDHLPNPSLHCEAKPRAPVSGTVWR